MTPASEVRAALNAGGHGWICRGRGIDLLSCLGEDGLGGKKGINNHAAKLKIACEHCLQGPASQTGVETPWQDGVKERLGLAIMAAADMRWQSLGNVSLHSDLVSSRLVLGQQDGEQDGRPTRNTAFSNSKREAGWLKMGKRQHRNAALGTDRASRQ